MGVRMGKRGIIPNWIAENDWSAEERMEWANKIMAFSPRDWSINFNSGDKPESPDPEIWALWCLITSDTKLEEVCREIDKVLIKNKLKKEKKYDK